MNATKVGIENNLPPLEAINGAIDKCINDNLLADFFIDSRSEVVNMFVEEMTLENYLKVVGKEEREEGKAEGIAIGEANGKAEGIAIGEAKGKAEGLTEGAKQKEQEMISSLLLLYKESKISLQAALELAKMSEEEFLELVK